MKENLALKNIIKYFSISEGKLLLGGRTLEEIASMVGTPFYAYDLEIAKKKIHMLRSALPHQVGIHYAIKANPHTEVVNLFKKFDMGYDVASVRELEIALGTGISSAQIGFAGPGKRESEIEYACEAEIGSLNVESEAEIELANGIAANKKKKLNIALRINPSFELTGSGMKMGGGPKQFGIDQEDIPKILQRFTKWHYLNFVGFHLFAGSQNLIADSLSAAFKKTFDAIKTLLPLCPYAPKQINIGGGFGIPYYAGDEELDIKSVGVSLGDEIKNHQSDFSETKLFVESGRYLIGECGVYVSRVLYKKVSRGEIFLILDGGMNHHLAASGNLGQIIKRDFPIVVPERLFSPLEETVNIVGPLCTPIDQFGRKIDVPATDPGDLIAILASGAYGYSASPLGFLSHPHPYEYIC